MAMSPSQKTRKKRTPARQRAKHLAEACLALSAAWLAAHTPLAVADAVCNILAVVLFDVLRTRRTLILENIGIAFPELSGPEKRKMGRASMRSALLSSVEFARLPEGQLGPEWHFEVHGEERIRELLERGSIIFTGGHLGNWESPIHCLSEIGLPLSIIYKPMHNPILDKKFLAVRASENAEFISTRLGDRKLWKRLSDAAKRGAILCFMNDQDARHKGIFVPFFGRPASTAPGAATMALRRQIPIVPVTAWRNSICRLSIEFGEPLEPPNVKRSQEAVEKLTALITLKLEESIRRFPDQYFWLHDRWKTQPGDAEQ